MKAKPDALQQQATQLEREYRQALEAQFRGHTGSAPVGVARVAWIQAMSRLVDRRLRGGK